MQNDNNDLDNPSALPRHPVDTSTSSSSTSIARNRMYWTIPLALLVGFALGHFLTPHVKTYDPQTRYDIHFSKCSDFVHLGVTSGNSFTVAAGMTQFTFNPSNPPPNWMIKIDQQNRATQILNGTRQSCPLDRSLSSVITPNFDGVIGLQPTCSDGIPDSIISSEFYKTINMAPAPK